MDLVSIIVTHYNDNESLAMALASVLAQTHKNIECIIVDDGSDVSPKSIIDKFNDSRLKLMQLECNQGRGTARQAALDKCAGDFIGFVDSDDWILPDKIDKQLKVLKKYPECVFVTCSMYIMGQSNSLLGVRRLLESADIKKYPAINSVQALEAPFAPCLIRSDKAKQIKFDINLKITEDFDYLLRLSRLGPYIKMKQPLYVYSEVTSLSKSKLLESYRASRRVAAKYYRQSIFSASYFSLMSYLKSAFVFTLGTPSIIKYLIGSRTKAASVAEKAEFDRSLAHIQSILK